LPSRRPNHTGWFRSLQGHLAARSRRRVVRSACCRRRGRFQRRNAGNPSQLRRPATALRLKVQPAGQGVAASRLDGDSSELRAACCCARQTLAYRRIGALC